MSFDTKRYLACVHFYVRSVGKIKLAQQMKDLLRLVECNYKKER